MSSVFISVKVRAMGAPGGPAMTQVIFSSLAYASPGIRRPTVPRLQLGSWHLVLMLQRLLSLLVLKLAHERLA